MGFAGRRERRIQQHRLQAVVNCAACCMVAARAALVFSAEGQAASVMRRRKWRRQLQKALRQGAHNGSVMKPQLTKRRLHGPQRKVQHLRIAGRRQRRRITGAAVRPCGRPTSRRKQQRGQAARLLERHGAWRACYRVCSRWLFMCKKLQGLPVWLELTERKPVTGGISKLQQDFK